MVILVENIGRLKSVKKEFHLEKNLLTINMTEALYYCSSRLVVKDYRQQMNKEKIDTSILYESLPPKLWANTRAVTYS